jgi:hypothetical protein
MSIFLNQILYDNTKFDTFDTIQLLDPYMYTKYSIIQDPIPISTSNVSSISQTIPLPIQVVVSPIKVLHSSSINSNIIKPKHTDTLFWCLYIAKYGYGEYLNIGNKYKNKEIEIKQSMIETIKKSPAILKSTSRKITNVAIQEIMAELMIDKKTTFKTFFAMSVLNNINAYILDTATQTYLPFLYGDDQEKPFIFYKSIDGFFSIDIEEKTAEQIHEIVGSMIELEHGERPIKSISAYKVADLETMAKHLHIEVDTKKYKKQDLYNEILAKLHISQNL